MNMCICRGREREREREIDREGAYYEVVVSILFSNAYIAPAYSLIPWMILLNALNPKPPKASWSEPKVQLLRNSRPLDV